MSTTRNVKPLIGLMGVASLLLAGCQGTEDSTASLYDSAYPPSTAAALADTSAANYDDNRYGLISGATLTHWIDDWAANKPAYISGELIIIQVSDGALTNAVDASCVDTNGDGTGVCKYFKPAPGVRSYSLGANTWSETRSNGVTETISVVPSGDKMDALLAAYDIDPRNDMIVFAMGYGGTSAAMQMGRAHYMFRYWGVGNKHVAMLNGGATHASVIPAGSRGTYLGEANSGVAPTGGTVTVRDLPRDNTILQATLGEMMAVARGEVANAFVWDARSAGEWGGNLLSTNASASDCVDVDDADGDGNVVETTSCKSALNGTVAGAVNLDYVQLLVTNDATENVGGTAANDPSYRYKDKATVSAMVDALGYTPGQTVYTFCRTTYRAMITGTVTGTILGYPTRYYDGAMVEWLQMANVTNKSGGENLPATSPWQTTALTDNLTYNTAAYVDTPVITDAYAASSDAVVAADRLYKSGSSASGTTAGSGSVALPANPCGG